MDVAAKDAYIAEHLMKLEPDTLRYMVADLTAKVEHLTELVKKMVTSAVNVQQGARDTVKFSDDRALEFKHEAERLAAGIQKALANPDARAYILEHTLKNGADNCCEGRCRGHGTAEAVRG